VRAGALTLASLLGLGCASGGVALEALPAEPIAFVYRTVEETQRMVDEAEARANAARAGTSGENRFDVQLDGLERLTGLHTDQDRLRDLQGRVALFVAPERRLAMADALPRGARPVEWSSDRRLMFSWERSGPYHLYEWDSGSGEVRQLTSGPESQVSGCYGPNGALAYSQAERVDGQSVARIWVRRPGEAPRRLTAGPLDVLPRWAPSGERIVYTADDGQGGGQLRWVDPTGGASGSLGPGRAARYSPDGQWIVYSARTTVGWRLRRMRPDGSGKRALGTSRYEETAPAFSPDGRFVVFAGTPSDASPVSRLFVRSLDGGSDRQLEFAGSGLLPVW
jgi:Tol biopolymer transport system component